MEDKLVGGSSESLDGPPYSLPGVLQFVQHEWARFERERSRWEIERAELQTKLSFLQGERRGQESLKFDLVRRIKMLEYALRQERLKYHKLKYGSVPPPVDTLSKSPEPDTASNTSNELRPGRQLLRQYLQEVNVTDTLLDVRDVCRSRVLNASSNSNKYPVGDGMHSRSLSTRSNSVSFSSSDNLANRVSSSSPPPGTERPPGMVDFTSDYKPKGSMPAVPSPSSSGQFSQAPGADMIETVSGDVPASEAECEAGNSQLDTEGEDSSAKEEERFSAALNQEPPTWMSPGSLARGGIPDAAPKNSRAPNTGDPAEALTRLLGSRSKEETSSTHSDGSCVSRENRSPEDKHPTESPKTRSSKRPSRAELATLTGQLTGMEDDLAPGHLPGEGGSSAPVLSGSPDPGTLMSSSRHTPPGITIGSGDGLDVQDLKGLVRVDSASEDQVSIDDTRKVWAPKFSLHSHFDCVRSVSFHPTDLIMLTASEDATVKLWNLEKVPAGKRNFLPDIEPVHTYRGHRGPVMTSAFSPSGDHCFTGGVDGKLFQWKVYSADADLYKPYNPDEDAAVLLTSHADCIWDMSTHNVLPLIASASADGTCCVRNWSKSADSAESVVQTLGAHGESGATSTPTSVDFVHNEPGQLMVSYRSGQAVLYDYETAKPICSFTGVGNTQINQIACHPTLSFSIAGLDDRRIVYLDHRTGQVMFSMLAHLEAVTCLSIDPNGLYLLSGSHDSSLRLWTIESRACIQEMTAHRKKYNESVFSVAFHPSKGYLASGGADSIAKVFT